MQQDIALPDPTPTVPGAAMADVAGGAKMVWRPAMPVAAPWTRLSALSAMGRGARGLCPNCGRAPLFTGFLRIAPGCAVCAAPLGRIRADDVPPYVTIMIIGHVAVAALLALETLGGLSVLAEAAILLPLTLAAAFAVMRPVKGAVAGLMLKLDLLAPEGAAAPVTAAPLAAAGPPAGPS